MIENGALNISEAAAQLPCMAQYLQLPECQGRIPPARRDFNGRIYSEFDVSLLKSMGVGSRPHRLKPAEEVVARQS
jgi:hypothetical protein